MSEEIPSENPSEKEMDHMHAMSLTAHMLNLWKTKSFTDLSVLCGEETYELHSSVLYHGSGYFREKMEDDMKLIDLDFTPPLEPSTFDIIVTSIYTGIVQDLDETNVTKVLEGGKNLDVPYVLTACADFMLEHLNLDTCLNYWIAAKNCDTTVVKKAAIGLIGRHLATVSDLKDFHEMDSEYVTEILSDPELQVPSEELVYEAAMKWIKYDVVERTDDLSYVLDTVRLPLLSTKFLVSVVGKEDLIENNPYAMGKYSKALMYKLDKSSASLDVKPRHNFINGIVGTWERMYKTLQEKEAKEEAAKEMTPEDIDKVYDLSDPLGHIGSMDSLLSVHSELHDVPEETESDVKETESDVKESNDESDMEEYKTPEKEQMSVTFNV